MPEIIYSVNTLLMTRISFALYEFVSFWTNYVGDRGLLWIKCYADAFFFGGNTGLNFNHMFGFLYFDFSFCDSFYIPLKLLLMAKDTIK